MNERFGVLRRLVFLVAAIGTLFILKQFIGERTSEPGPVSYSRPMQPQAKLLNEPASETAGRTDSRDSGSMVAPLDGNDDFVGSISIVEGGSAFGRPVQLVLVEDADGWSMKLHVKDGEWMGVLPVGRVRVEAAMMDGVEIPYRASSLLSPDTPRISVALQQRAPAVLELVDEITREIIAAGFVLADTAEQFDRSEVSDKIRSMGRKEVCPIPVWRIDGLIWVSANGYETKGIRVPPGMRRVAVTLRPVGSARIRWADSASVDIGGGSRIWLESKDNPVWALEYSAGRLKGDPRLIRGENRIDEIPAGHYTCRAREGTEVGAQCGAVLGEASFVVGRGKSTEVVLDAVRRVSAEIVVAVADAAQDLFPDPAMELRVSRREQHSWRMRGRATVWEHDPVLGLSSLTIDRMQPGEYRFELRPFGAIKDVELRPGATEEWFYDSSEFAALTVRSSGVSRHPGRGMIAWGYAEEDPGLQRIGPFDPDGTLLPCLGRTLWLQAFIGPQSSGRVWVDLSPGEETTVDLTMDRATSGLALHPVVREGGGTFSADYWKSVEILPTAGCSGWHVTNQLLEAGGLPGILAIVSEPGDYLLELPALPELGGPRESQRIPVHIGRGIEAMDVHVGGL